MSDDIDIEEHNLLDNPVIREIFPDLSILKKEIGDHLDTVSAESFDSAISDSRDKTTTGLTWTYEHWNEQTASSLVKKDVLKSTVSSKLNNRQTISSNKIILGSKPAKIHKIQATLVISDIGPYLERSDKYCKECLILYPNKFNLDGHLKSVHQENVGNTSIKIKKKIKLPTCSISNKFSNSWCTLERRKTKHERKLGESLKKFVKTNNILNDKSKINTKKHSCSHCQKLFPTESALIEHMYEILKPKKNQITFDQGLIQNKQIVRATKYDQHVIKGYKCQLCPCYFRTTKYYFDHILKKHKTARISNIKKVPLKLNCKNCDINFKTTKTYNVHINKSHLKQANPKMNNIRDNLNKEEEKTTSEIFNPPVQLTKSCAYKSLLFKCSLCDVHFISANTAMQHLHHLEILIHWKCNICHRIFKKNDEFHHETQHIYSDEFNVYNLDNSSYLKILFKCFQCDVHFTEENYILHPALCGMSKSLSKKCQVCNILIDETTMMGHKYSHDYKKIQKGDYIIISPEGVIGDKNENNKSATLAIPNNNEGIQLKNAITKDFDCIMPNILFLCKNCCHAADSYDKTIRHCQEHYQTGKEMITLECNICLFRFSTADYAEHKILHEKKQWNVTSLKVCSYDNAYFLSENEIWIQHLFGTSCSKEFIKESLETSIYRYEHRLKLHILQDGCTDITVYKCEKCCRFIDPFFINKHLDSCLLNVKRHPCPICGLPFISTNSRNNHQKVHETAEVGLKSYKIISFNRFEDATFNTNIMVSNNQHLLFQCRICYVAIHKGEVSNHKLKCSNSDIKKCEVCGLLIYKSDYESHVLKHKDLKNFNEKTIKIILFGMRNDKDSNFGDLQSSTFSVQPSFGGVIIDYTFYKCSKCAVCVNDLQSILAHSCDFSVPRTKCPKCSMYLTTIYLHKHLKMHDRDTEFRQEYINFITFDIKKLCEQLLNQDLKLRKLPVVIIERKPSLYRNKKIAVENNIIEEVKLSHLNLKNSTNVKHTNRSNKAEDSLSEIIEAVELFKCFCGLHFLDKMSATTHHTNCNAKFKICKQTCSKCGLLFTPNELFTHILNHHGNKSIKYKYNVIDIQDDRTEVF